MALKIQVTHRDLCEVCGFYNSRCNDVHATLCMEINPANSDNETSLYQGIFLQADCCNSTPDHQITSTDTSNCGESMDIIYTIHANVDTVAPNQDHAPATKTTPTVTTLQMTADRQSIMNTKQYRLHPKVTSTPILRHGWFREILFMTPSSYSTQQILRVRNMTIILTAFMTTPWSR